jgi:hypothetical protein
VRIRIGAFQDRRQDIDANLPAGDATLRPFQAPATICED